MKSKLTKILLVVLTCVMLFGALVPSAYESYDTYTYSIDGIPLRSPAAYTPAPNTYDSESMGLLAGNHWRYDSKGGVGVWDGDMITRELGIEFSSDQLEFIFNDDSDGDGVVDGYTVYLKSGVSALPAGILIPETYEDKPVTAISDNFLYSEDAATAEIYYAVTHVIIGKNVKKIGENAFNSTGILNYYNNAVYENGQPAEEGTLK